MSLLSILSLDDDNIEMVTTVVRAWCHQHQVPPDSERGREAMSEAVRLALGGERSTHVLNDMLSRHMRIEQYRHPIE
jgi:hypothetical protein